MKRFLSISALVLALGGSAFGADTSVKLSNVHLCCDKCVKGVDKAVTSVPGATSSSDKASGTVTITAPDQAAVQKAANAVVAAGYFGTSSDPAIKIEAKSGAKKGKVSSLKVSGVHLCCDKCVKGMNEALSTVPGVKGNTAVKGAESFEVTGEFKAKAVFTALNKAGFSGTAAN